VSDLVSSSRLSQDIVEQSIAALIGAAESGDSAAVERLFAALYSELHGMARHELARNMGGTISATTLLHETYLDLVKRNGPAFAGREHFMKYACRVMRGLIIDHVRQRNAQKRGGLFELTSFDASVEEAPDQQHELMRLNDALDELAAVDGVLAQTVDLKFFCGFTFSEIAAIQGISERSVQRNWSKARMYLRQSIQALEI
jgi:RNA polymerase sigma factor (TIGR02999 family)